MSRKPTTSFFDTDHSAKRAPSWKRNPNALQQRDPSSHASRTNSAAGSIPVSTETKSKLGAFAFNKPSTPIKAATKPGNAPGCRGGGGDDNDGNDLEVSKSNSKTTTPGPDAIKECPKTPAPRLQLSDLIGIGDEGTPTQALLQARDSPEDRIMWQMSPRGTPNGASQTTPAPKKGRRGKKRTASPNVVTPIGKKRGETINLQRLGVLKTPLADPAMQLWSKYSTAGNSSGSNPDANPAARLYGAEGTNQSPLGLRRAYSCGPDWPQTRLKKKRKVVSPEDISELDEVPEGPTASEGVSGNRAPGPSRLSRVSQLVDKMKETLEKPSSMPNILSSSPLHENYLDGTSSPIRRGGGGRTYTINSQAEESDDDNNNNNNDNDNDNNDDDDDSNDKEEGHIASSGSEDFGDFDDDDIDMMMLDKAEVLAESNTGTHQTTASLPGGPVVEPELPSGKGQQFLEPETLKKSVVEEEEEDEFGDDDDDEFSAGVENLISKYEATQTSVNNPNTSSPDQQRQSIQSRPEYKKTATEIAASQVLEEFGDVDFDDWNDEELELSNGLKDLKPKSIRRYLVLEISLGSWIWKNQSHREEKVLRVKAEKEKVECIIKLRENWYDTIVVEGDHLHLIGSFDSSRTCIVDNAHNMVILHPDFLVSCTVVADSFSCVRKSVMQDRVKAAGDISRPLVYGNILHALFQAALMANDFSTVYLNEVIDKLVVEHVESLYVLHEEIPVATEYVRSKSWLIQEWAKTFVAVKPKKNATVTDHRGQSAPIVAVNKLLDIEEHIWSPMYGLKGNIDATIQSTIIDSNGEKTLTIPLELKSGKNSSSTMHRAQTMLYTLLMSDRYDIDVACGMLYYIERAEMIRVPAIRDELRGMIIGRNEIASYSRNRTVLPEMLRNKGACERCYAKTPCFIYHKLLEDGTPETSGAEKAFTDLTHHLGNSDAKFFKHWDTLLSKEEKDFFRYRRELWGMISSEREAVGRCFGNLVIEPGSVSMSESSGKINKYTYSFSRKTNDPTLTFLDSQISLGEPIVISDEKNHYALALGYVTDIRSHKITVQVDRRLHNARTRESGFDGKKNQVFTGIMEVTKDGKSGQKPLDAWLLQARDEEMLFRLDKDEFSNGMATVRNNLIQMMVPTSAEKYRRLIIHLETPKFKDSPMAYTLENAENLNGDQRRASEKVMTAHDYALVLGMPGTGKTTTIAHIIRALVNQGKSVLLTSYTHTAVDNILLKIRNDNIDILRIGSGAKIHPLVKGFAQLAETPRKTFKEIHDVFHKPKVVATTCLGINHIIFNERKFDYCIVDEASQITLPVCLGPIRMANTFILVGDHYQLPPLVRNPEAREGGLDTSLFKLLCEAHPQAVVNLEHQYRMCKEIMTLSNELIYNGMLKCGNEQVANKKLEIPNIKGLDRLHSQSKACTGSPCWIRDLLGENVKACFVNTDTVPAREERRGDRINNPVEAELAFQLVEGLITTGIDPSSIGVISVYRSQIKIIQNLLRSRPTVEMHTADKFQGRDKEVVIISLVRSNDDQNVGELLRDWRRINVAFTRAKTKLIILGSKTTLSTNELLASFVGLMERNNWVYNLPAEAQAGHFMPMLHAQSQSQRQENRGGASGDASEGEAAKLVKVINGKKDVVSRADFLGNRPILRDIVNGMG